MEHKIRVKTIASDMTWRGTYDCSVRRVRATVVGLGVVGALLAGGRSAAAQTPFPPAAAPPVPGRLTVRPHEMATGAQTAQAGQQPLDSLNGYLVYVPQPCVGTRRCPLVVLIGGGGYGSAVVMKMHARHAEKYGMILLAPDPITPGYFDLMNGYRDNKLKTDPDIPYPIEERPTDREPFLVREMPENQDFRNIDAAMKQVLRKYAIDPDKIAVAGMSNAGTYSLFLGLNNLDVFSRIAALSPSPLFTGVGPQNKTTQFFISGGIAELRFWKSSLIAAQDVRKKGYRFKQVLALRGSDSDPDHFPEDHDLMWRWLQESWKTPDPAKRPIPPTVADPLPVLTTEAITQTTTFWTRFMAEPDSIRTTARLAHLKEFTVPIGQTKMSVLMADIPTLAGKYPSVAAALKAAGLTARQHQAFRAALISAHATRQLGKLAGTVKLASVMGKNIKFLEAHPNEVGALEATRMWINP